MTSEVAQHAPERGSSAGWGWRELLRRPPRGLFHGILIATGIVVLWAFSFPGVHFLAVVPCIWIVGLAAVTWVVRGITYLAARRRATHTGHAAWFAVAPLGAFLLGLLLSADVPLRFRWEISRSAFKDAAADVRADPEASTSWHPRRIGTYRITTVRIVPQGIVFYEDRRRTLRRRGIRVPPGRAFRRDGERQLREPAVASARRPLVRLDRELVSGSQRYARESPHQAALRVAQLSGSGHSQQRLAIEGAA